MTTSGTTAFTLDLTDLVEEAYERASGGSIELRSGYDLRTARRSLNLMMVEWASRGINLWTVEQGTVALTSGTATYTLPADTVDLIEHVIRQNAGSVSGQTDINISRISIGTYSTIPNKLTPGRPIQIYINRQRDAPTVTVWPVPGDNTYSLVYWRLRRIQDAGNGTETPDVPFRFLPALVAGLAYFLAMKLPGMEQRAIALKSVYEEAFQLAADEDRDRAPVRFVPYVGRM